MSGILQASSVPSGASAPSFLPSDIAGLTIWARNGAGLFQDSGKTTPAVSGDPLGAWADQSGSGNDLLQATSAKRPALVTSGGKTVANSPHSDGRSMTITASLTLKPVTFFCLVNPRNDGDNQYLLQAASNTLAIFIAANTLVPSILKQDVTIIGSGTAMTADVWQTLICTYGSAGAWEIFLDGVSVGSGTNDVAISGAAGTGFGDPAGPVPLDGEMAEWGVYDNVVSSPNIALLNAYLHTIL